MSGILGETFTPCPSKSRSSGASSYGNNTLDSFIDSDATFETTGNIEFTAEIRVPTLTGARPRRANRTGSGFQIHDDGEKAPAPEKKRSTPNKPTKELSGARKSSLLAQPAQRIRPTKKAPLASSQDIKEETRPLQRPGRIESNPMKQPPRAERAVPNKTIQSISPASKNSPRRNAIFIPPDDATPHNVFMDLFSPLKNQQAKLPPRVAVDKLPNPLETRSTKQQTRKSLAVSARRAPLQPSKKIAQESVFRVDIAGKNGGKENVPPGMCFDVDKKRSPPSKASLNYRASDLSLKSSTVQKATRQLQDAKFSELPGAAKLNQSKRGVLRETQGNVKSLPAPAERRKAAKGPALSASLNTQASALSGRLGRSGSNGASNTRCVPSSLMELNAKYPKLTEDIQKPALYEDDWLSHQETVITQLVNSLFEHSNGGTEFYGQNTLRLEFLELYHTDTFIQLYQRLQASLSCGALTIPKQVLSRGYRLKQDIGLRRKFLDLWMHSYDLHALAPAAETVIGRKISSDHDLFENDEKVVVRRLESFLDTFLLRNEDFTRAIDVKEISTVDNAKTYQRTVLRCIMLVALLDQARQSPGSIVPRQLFVSTSQLKSSLGVLQALARVLVPSYGDITKTLAHLGCCLSYRQHKLQEYNYQVENIAVDLRDGVRLTRIIEILFFKSNHIRLGDPNKTEVILSSGEILSLLGEHADVPLSKHLKYPCVSRAAKISNVQIALSALNSIKGSSSIFGDIRPEEIVDGYREKTITLLWALMSGWGLAALVNWGDVTKEISRLKRKSLAIFGDEFLKNKAWFTGEQYNADVDEHTRLLQQWAALLAGLKGIHIDNLTTSFANGKIYESIVDEYEPYIIGNASPANANSSTCSNFRSLPKRLTLLGCSSQFAQLVSADSLSSHVLDRECTLGSLAFLCSRLLTASKRARAATIIQRAWRERLESCNIYQRSIAKILATQCAAVVQTRNEILWAKDVIIRWWRLKQAQRYRKLATRA